MHFLKPSFGKSHFNGLLLIALLIGSFTVLFSPTGLAEPWNVQPQGSFLQPKWVGYVAGGGEALLTADVNPNISGEEVFHAGGPPQPSDTPGRVTCLNGVTGEEIWRTNIYMVGDTATLQTADIEGDGKLELIVALQSPAGLYILNAEDGSELWKAPGTITYNGSSIGGFIEPVGGRVDGSGTIADIDGDGYPTVFIGVMAYEEQPTTGKLIAWEWDPTLQTMVEQARTTVWHPCAGGLSIGDTDNDGTFEIYMNERDVYYGDGSWGRGITSFWADNLTLRWRIYDWGASSNIPMLADVNKDGILDVVSTNLGTGVCVLNSTDGRPLTNAEGTVLYDQLLGLPVHYQSTIYDIDGDGSLELMCADGTHVASGMGFISNYTMIWDLYNWRLDGVINAGLAFRGPSVGEVTGDGVMDIIVTIYDESGNKSDAVKIYDQNFALVDQFVGLRRPAIGSVVQDIDRDDGGLNELLVLTQGGIIYCFDTPGIAANPRARSEVHFYSESRNGVSEYVPFERPWPDVSPVNPPPGAVNVSTALNTLSFKLNHPLGQTMNYTVTTTPNIGSGSGTNVGNGIRNLTVSGLTASTLYRWQVNATDQSGHVTSKNYWFTTAPYITNSAPTQGTPVLNSTDGGNTLHEDLVCYNQSTADVNGNAVTNIYNWVKNGLPLANLNLPFESKPNANAVYCGYAVTKDYSSYGNDGTVFGATWTEGIVGGGFSFDGNDFIRIEEQGNSLGGDGSWSEISVECWIKATTTMSSKPVIWKTDRYEPEEVGYRLDCSANMSSSSLSYKWLIYTSSESFSVNYVMTSGVSDWHHLVCTYKSGVGLKIYVDGIERASSGSTAPGSIKRTDGPLEIAFNSILDYSSVVDYSSYIEAQQDFKGILDEVKVYSFEMSDSLVDQRYLETRDGLSNKATIPSSELAVNDRWTCQVTPNDGLTDGITKTSNMVKVAAPLIFADGFESGGFSAWNGNYTTTGGSAIVFSNQPHSGSYSAQLNISSGSGTRRAYCYKTLTGYSELYASAYVYIADGLPLASQQSLWLIQLTNASDHPVGSFGIRADNTSTKWAIQYSNWPFILGASSPSEGGWYHIEAYYNNSGNGKTLALYVNEIEVAFLEQDTIGSSDVTSVRFGVGYYSGTSAISVYMDDAAINAPSVQASQRAYLSVRGVDNSIYYREYDEGSNTWNAWNLLPGATIASPAACVFEGKLHLVVLGIDGTTLWHGYVNLENNQFSGWQVLSGVTNSAPILTSNGTVLSIIAKGLDNAIYIRSYQNGAWESWKSLSSGLTDSPLAAVFVGDYLHIVAKELNGKGMFDAIVSCDGTIIRDWILLSGASESVLTLASSQGENYLVARGLDNVIYFREYNVESDSWSAWSSLPGATCDGVGATVINGKLQLVVRGIDLFSLWQGSVDIATKSFSGWTSIEGAISSKPTFVNAVPSTADFDYLGFSGYTTSQAELENTIALMKSQNLNAYRISFKPSWQVLEGELRCYNASYIDYLLVNTDFFVVVDGNHLYPRDEQSIYAQSHWDQVRDRVFEVLQDYPNNPRVAVELINEYAQSDYDAKMQALIDEIRDAGYTNPIVTNKLTTIWLKFTDPLDNTYQGMHFYFNHWEASEAIEQMNIALSRGVTKILNTEIGAHSDEYEAFTQQNVDELETFLMQSQALGVNNCIWMNDDTENWQGYTLYDFTFDTPIQNP